MLTKMLSFFSGIFSGVGAIFTGQYVIYILAGIAVASALGNYVQLRWIGSLQQEKGALTEKLKACDVQIQSCEARIKAIHIESQFSSEKMRRHYEGLKKHYETAPKPPGYGGRYLPEHPDYSRMRGEDENNLPSKTDREDTGPEAK